MPTFFGNMRIAQDLSMSQVRKAGKSWTVRSAARFSPGVDLAGRGWGPTVVTRANVATLFPWVPESGWPLPLAKPMGWQNGGKIDKAFRIATPMRKASWTKRFAEGWGERRGANADGGSGGEGWREWAGGVSEKSLPMRAALEKPRPLWLEDAAQGCRNRRFRSPARQGHGTPKRGYSPRNRVRQLPQWGHRGRAAS